METSGNLDGLVERVLAQAREEAAALVERSAKAAERETQRAEQERDRRRAAVESALREAAERRTQAARAEAEHEKRRAAMNAREAAVVSVFEEALHSLREIGAPEERRRLLEALVREGIRALGASPVRVRLNAAERELALDSRFPKELDGVPIALDEDATDAVGGPVVTDESGRVVFENTFEARLDRMRETLRRLVANTLRLEDRQGGVH